MLRRGLLAASLCVGLCALGQEASTEPEPTPTPTPTTSGPGTKGTIHIGKKVYGGGEEASVNTANAVLHDVTNYKDDLPQISVTDPEQVATNVTIYDGNITHVIGGGAMGCSFGRTNVVVNGPKVKIDSCIFGAGEGDGAGVLGGSSVLFIDGTVGKIYGGADAAFTVGSTSVEIRGCQAIGSVYGGSRVQDVYGNALVYLNGAKSTTNILIDTVFGGNDINGLIAPANKTERPYWSWAWPQSMAVPTAVADAIPNTSGVLTKDPQIDNTWNAFVYASKPAAEAEGEGYVGHTLHVGTMFVGGNGAYDYVHKTLPVEDPGDTSGEDPEDTSGEDPEVKTRPNPYYGYSAPELAKGYIQLDWGTAGQVYGGGNNATITESTDICINNATALATDQGYACVDPVNGTERRLHYGKVFGGNNMARMEIRPNWYLIKGGISNLYSGGNAGDMTYFYNDEDKKRYYGGIVLAIESAGMDIDNVYGGCRLADVNPGLKGDEKANYPLYSETLCGVNWRGGYAARVVVKDGKVNNVYGGNDIAGTVYYGTQVEILHSIRGNVYGAGNGSYMYTNQLDADGEKSDYYYDVDKVLAEAGVTSTGKTRAVEALNIYRPDAQKAWIHLNGTADKKTYIDGAVFCGGNSTTLCSPAGDLANAEANLQIGTHVVANEVFLGSNGEMMVAPEIMAHYTNNAAEHIDLRDSDIMAEYMRGVEVKIRPTITFDDDYPHDAGENNALLSKWSWIGSLYLGGNVGSMSSTSQFTYDIDHPLMIFDKLVGGCNNANVPKSDNNAFYAGGLIRPALDADGQPLAKKVVLDLSNLRLDPRVYDREKHSIDKMRYYWPTVSASALGKPDGYVPQVTDFTPADTTVKSHGNIYGGCYASGHINGGVEINITGNLLYTGYTYTAENYHPESAFDIMSSRLSAYGGGYGVETEIWGDVDINVSGRGQILKVFGGGEKGVVGRVTRNVDGKYILETPDGDKPGSYPDILKGERYKVAEGNAHSTRVSLMQSSLPQAQLYNVPCVYGGGYEGIVTGSTEVWLDNAHVHTVFGGACNADIYGTTSLYLGARETTGPLVDSNAYGGNDFGGRVLGFRTVEVDNTGLDCTVVSTPERPTADASAVPQQVLTQTYVQYNLGNIKGNLFGGSCGNYHYASTYGYLFTPPADATKFDDLRRRDKLPFSLPMLDNEIEHMPEAAGKIAVNSFVNVTSISLQPTDCIEGAGITSTVIASSAATADETLTVYDKTYNVNYITHTGGIFGGSEGQLGRIGLADQCGSYVRLAANDSRQTSLAPNVFGGGYCSHINHSTVDAFGGRFGTIYGGSYGMNFEERSYASDYSTTVALHIAVDKSVEDEIPNFDKLINVEFLEVAYRGKRSEVRLHNMRNAEMDIFGAGANAGSEEAIINLYSGQARDIYGASYSQGYTYCSNVYVPNGSNTKVRAIFGGAYGDDARYICDVANSFVSYHSPDARVSEAIYGGNNSNRMTRSSFIEIDCPVYQDDYENLCDVFGAGKGENTVSTFTNVALRDGARVRNVYGGGCDGRIMSSSSLRAFCLETGDKVPYYDGKTKKWHVYEGKLKYLPDDVYEYAYQHDRLAFRWHQLLIDRDNEFHTPLHRNARDWSEVSDDVIDEMEAAYGSRKPTDWKLDWPGFTKYKYSTEVGAYHAWTLDQKAKNGMYRETLLEPKRGEPGEESYQAGSFYTYDFPAYRPKGFSTPLPLYEHGQTTYRKNNSKVRIYAGAEVAQNVFGAGKGEYSTVTGTTDVRLLGGVVRGNIYGGGEEGDVNTLETVRVFDSELLTSRSKVQIIAGSATNVYGGGLKGGVYGLAFTTVGLPNSVEGSYLGIATPEYTTTDKDGNQVYVPETYTSGDPAIERSLYGGGHMGRVDCMANLMINQGHIGYYYDTDSLKYCENIDLVRGSGDKLLVENGNVFGGGYGEGANTYYSTIWMYGGTIRNSLYGGGEIASIGIGPQDLGEITEESEAQRLKKAAYIARDIRNPITESMSGHTHVIIMQGNVHGDVFGGGRGYSYNLQGATVNGEKLFSDGYVFGNTHVSIRGGVIGTDKTLAKGQGNVFGGGNTGFLYTGAVKCTSDPSSPYYTDQSLLYGDPHQYIEDRYYTNEWVCDSCGAITRSYRKPHACWSCQHHDMPNAVEDYTSFSPSNTTGLVLSEDTRVVVTPYLQVLPDGNGQKQTLTYTRLPEDYQYDEDDHRTDDGTITFTTVDFVPPRYLNTMLNEAAQGDRWDKLDERGIIIRNSVFGGGNVSSGSDRVYANATTVFGNATATLNDLFFRDMISLGQAGIGGLYGEGNLTLVDGYRELNITNYGTDYYNMPDDISYETYQSLSDREKAYFDLQYKCTVDYDSYAEGQIISSESYDKLTDAEKENWVPDVCHIFDGRMMNTIQRADFCGVFGSRIVLNGAEDRVISEVDYRKYTINRLGELSLNKSVHPYYTAANNSANLTGTALDEYNLMVHGNYFGMYSVVNYLGGLTSDVYFSDVRVADPEYRDEDYAKPTATYYDWKAKHHTSRTRNNGESRNKVALASGVALELVREPANASTSQLQADVTSTADKNYGYITGIVELDLINIAPGEGGGYVYAKNEHGDHQVPTSSQMSHTNLSIYNNNARTNLAYTYDEDETKPFQTSGNFVHPTKRIIDNCYPTLNSYEGDDASPAHYWFIKGDYYVYDQVISAYTGSATAYSATIELPLTIALGSQGKLQLINIQPNLYAYYDIDGSVLEEGEQVLMNSKNYHLNDIITYWDYSLLSDTEKACFVPQTMVATRTFRYTDATTGDLTIVPEGSVYLPTNIPVAKDGTKAYEIFEDGTADTMGKNVSAFVRSSNEVSHGNGYALAVSYNNPVAWDRYYSPVKYGDPKEKLSTAEYDASDVKNDLLMGPTYTPMSHNGGVYGQRWYNSGDPMPKSQKDQYDDMMAEDGPIPDDIREGIEDQAVFDDCYVSIRDIEYTTVVNEVTVTRKLNAGVGISKTEYETLSTGYQGAFTPAYICRVTYPKLEHDQEYYYPTNLVSKAEYDALLLDFEKKYLEVNTSASADDAKEAFASYFEPAVICTEEGNYGGQYYAYGTNYGALQSWANLTGTEREHFEYNIDALDLLAFSDVLGHDGSAVGMYPGFADADNNNPGHMGIYDDVWCDIDDKYNIYNVPQGIDYNAIWDGLTDADGEKFEYYLPDGTKKEVTEGVELDRQTYEALPNERQYYTPVDAVAGTTMRIVNEQFSVGQTIYPVGQVLSQAQYDLLPPEKRANVGNYDIPATMPTGQYYFCRQAYKVGEAGYTIDGGGNSTRHSFDDARTATTYAINGTVPVGAFISEATYNGLVDTQTNFSIVGNSPLETTTLYVSRMADIDNLTSDRVFSVIYQYSYQESDETGTNIENIIERHIINVRLQFRSGEPAVGQLEDPAPVLPNQSVGLKLPNVEPGAFEVIGGGWEIYETLSDATAHRNGREFGNALEPVYWYQDGYYVAYYAKTFLGKTFSNTVQLNVANYHDLNAVLNHPQYMYVDHPGVDHKSKIYIDDRICYQTDGATEKTAHGNSLTELDLLSQLFATSLESNLHTVETDVQQVDGDGNLLYYAVDDNGNVTTTKTTTQTSYPAMETAEVPVFDEHARNCNNLEFFFNTDMTLGDPEYFEPLGNATDGCFSGVVHGMGHTISGMPCSLFGTICGNVYNLGVAGTFTTSGIADASAAKGPSFGCKAEDADPDTKVTDDVALVANCWVYTTATGDKTGAPVFNPSNPAPKDHYHLINCYYPADKGYTGADAEAYGATAEEFRNGKVAYNLNGFYLTKRYGNANWNTGKQHIYLYKDADGSYTQKTGYYDVSQIKYPSYTYGTAVNAQYLYVERQWIDGDFLYRYGEIPQTDDVRKIEGDLYYRPIWPDDYIFFGQDLTYNFEADHTYTGLPQAVNKLTDCTFDPANDNRVYRAPGFYRSAQATPVYFNQDAWFVAQTKQIDENAPVDVHRNLTAIDFTGNDKSPWSLGYTAKNGSATTCFYGPLLDMEDGIKEFNLDGLTQNLLVYTPNDGSKDVVAAKLVTPEPTFSESDANRSVAIETAAVAIMGHLVYSDTESQMGENPTLYTTCSDHFLVDKQDFYAPYAYKMGGSATNGYRMWYQRQPERFTDGTRGWIDISLPFESELVSTQDKGEITHFYDGSKVGHEYWLRELRQVTNDANEAVAAMRLPLAVPAGVSKHVGNTFLFDYYYRNQYDENSDAYQQNYYNDLDREYKQYPFAKGLKPYLLGLPGKRFYEFDLSGEFEPQHTAGKVPRLSPQTLTFASHPAATIGSSLSANPVACQGYEFVPSTISHVVPASDADNSYYLLSADGSKYVLVTAKTTVDAFRPYFKNATGGKLNAPRSIRLDLGEDTKLGDDDKPAPGPEDELADGADAGISVEPGKGRVKLTSTLDYDTVVRIYNISGILVRECPVKSGETAVARVSAGYYVVNGVKVQVK